LSTCPVKAIKIKDEQAEIVEELCIGCGQCLAVCPQHAREVKSDLVEIKEAIADRKRMLASVAPSFIGAFEMADEGQIVAALKSLGFSIVEETAIGADVVAKFYKQYMEENRLENLITTSCPSANYLVERYFPSLVKYLTPLVSPMLAHGKLMKHYYGMDSYTVFIGPCMSKKAEAMDFQHEGIIDAVLTFDELLKWFEDEKIILKDLEAQPFDQKSYKGGCGFPLRGGVIESFFEKEETFYEIINADGIKECINLFESMEKGNINNVCIEANVCDGGCVGGLGMPQNGDDFFQRNKRIKEYVRKKEKSHTTAYEPLVKSIKFSKAFFNRSVKKPKASEKEIQTILRKMGKYEAIDELNCGTCGYNTCREKAQAVFHGMAEINMCLPYMRSKAERMTNVIFENTPNIIIIVDENMRIKEFNPKAEKVFKVKAVDIKNQPVSVLIDDSCFYRAKEMKGALLNEKIAYEQHGLVLQQSMLYLEQQNVIFAIMTDVTAEEKRSEELIHVKQNALDTTQEIIEKQMRVAQEIASLLGETTGETKVTLTRLKELIDKNGDVQ
jgi:iron only hydrogenase large subunit-like protein/uncharacterized Fe-S cluster-containing protein